MLYNTLNMTSTEGLTNEKWYLDPNVTPEEIVARLGDESIPAIERVLVDLYAGGDINYRDSRFGEVITLVVQRRGVLPGVLCDPEVLVTNTAAEAFSSGIFDGESDAMRFLRKLVRDVTAADVGRLENLDREGDLINMHFLFEKDDRADALERTGILLRLAREARNQAYFDWYPASLHEDEGQAALRALNVYANLRNLALGYAFTSRNGGNDEYLRKALSESELYGYPLIREQGCWNDFAARLGRASYFFGPEIMKTIAHGARESNALGDSVTMIVGFMYSVFCSLLNVDEHMLHNRPAYIRYAELFGAAYLSYDRARNTAVRDSVEEARRRDFRVGRLLRVLEEKGFSIIEIPVDTNQD